MKYHNWIAILTFLCFSAVYSQENYSKHKVLKGETISSISKHYNVSIQAIYEFNPNSKKGIKANAILLIPQSNNSVSNTSTENLSNSNLKTHTVQAKETLYGISKQYSVSLNELYKFNPEINKSELKIGQKINIPISSVETQNPIIVAKSVQEEQKIEVNSNKSSETILRVVLPKETKYGIAKEYGITIEELEQQNPSIVNNLTVGCELSIKRNAKVQKQTSLPEKNSVANQESFDDKIQLKNKLIESASENIGTRYRSGGTTKNGFDCSGLVYSTFEKFNIILPRSSIEQSSIGEKIDLNCAAKGDLIFFKTGKGNRISHVGMVVEVQDGAIKFIHSSTQQGVIVSSTDESYYAKNLVQVNRVL